MTHLIWEFCKTYLSKVSGDTAFLRQLWQPYLQRFRQEKKMRLSGSLLVSLSLHALALSSYFMLTTIEARVEPQIREIQFIDMTDVVTESKPPPRPEPKRQQLPKLAARTIPATVQTETRSNTSESQAAKPGNDRQHLDRRRRQAPIHIARETAVNQNVSSDALKISPAMGLKRDQRVARPAAIDLNRDKKLATLDKSVQNGALSMERRADPTLDLSRKPLTPAGGDGAIEITKSPKKATSPQQKVSAKRTQTLITGPLADRPILTRFMPAFPEWAKQQGIGANITLRFTVMENGRVKENVIVERTSGSRAWDHEVIDVLKQWVFEALPNSGVRRDQTGSITFQFVI